MSAQKRWAEHGCTVYTADEWHDGTNYGCKWIAQTFKDGTDEWPTEDEFANARLIAAAPDLLAALQICLAYLGSDADDKQEAQDYAQAVAALAKARAK